MGRSLFDVSAKALREFFCAPNWKDPRPRRGTILEVTILGDQRRYRVVAGRVERWMWEQAARRTSVRRFDLLWLNGGTCATTVKAPATSR